MTNKADSTPADEGDLKHVWVRYLIMPVNVYRNDSDGEPHVEYDRAAIQVTLDEPDLRIGCLTCNEPLDDAWGTACRGADVDKMLEQLTGD